MTKLTQEQEQMVKDAIGDGTDWPRQTEDPEVNCAVDHQLDPENNPAWEDLSEEDREMYRIEAGIFERN